MTLPKPHLTSKSTPAILAFLALAALQTSCGLDLIENPSHKTKKVAPPLIFEPENAGGYALFDPDCTYEKETKDIFTIKTHLFDGNIHQNITQPAYEVISDNGLSSPFVKGAIKNFSVKQSCQDGLCENTVLSHGSTLRICKQEAHYPRGSIEEITLTAQNHLESFFSFYKKIPDHKALTPVYINTLASVEKKAVNGSTYLKKNNMSYVRGGGYAAIYLLAKDNWGNYHWPGFQLWESPWVIAHEAAHHVFSEYSYSPLNQSAQTVKMWQSAPILSHPRKEEELGNFALAKRTVSHRFAISSVNEGFSDLMAFYSIGENTSYLDLFYCFRKSRDPSSPYFADGRKKTFDKKAVAAFLSSSYLKVATCEQTNFQNLHTVGAVFAHGLYRLYTLTPHPDVAQSGPELLLTFLKRIKPLLQNTANSQSYLLGRLLKEAIRPASHLGALTSDQCQAIKELFPFYEKSLFQDGSLFCET